MCNPLTNQMGPTYKVSYCWSCEWLVASWVLFFNAVMMLMEISDLNLCGEKSPWTLHSRNIQKLHEIVFTFNYFIVIILIYIYYD